MTTQAEHYWQYLQRRGAGDPALRSSIAAICGATNWENPQSSLDWNNSAVLALIAAEQAEAPAQRLELVQGAMQALSRGHDPRYGSTCMVHIAVLHCLLGDLDNGIGLALAAFINLPHLIHSAGQASPLALVYLPSAGWHQWPQTSWRGDALAAILRGSDGSRQLLLLASEVLSLCAPAYFSPAGLRFLELAHQVRSDAAQTNLRLGIAYLKQRRPEGLLPLHRAAALAPEHPTPLQALYLAYKGLGANDVAASWQARGREVGAHAAAPAWRWAHEPLDSPLTYVSFEDRALAVEPGLHSSVTALLLGESGWREPEMALWRRWIEPGMTVVDAGANIGYYTLSAALRAGASGRVLAVEPCSACVGCLRETLRLNDLAGVTLYAGAASDHSGTVQIQLRESSDVSAVISAQAAATLAPGAVETSPCITLDALCEQEGMTSVDVLKIDVEGHEYAVLRGAERVLRDHAPLIFYENSMDGQGSNRAAARHLWQRGYQLFHYQPYLDELAPIATLTDLDGKANLIALPAEKARRYAATV